MPGKEGGREGGQEGGRTANMLSSYNLPALPPSLPPSFLSPRCRAACALLHEVCPALEVGVEQEEELKMKGGGRVVATRVIAR